MVGLGVVFSGAPHEMVLNIFDDGVVLLDPRKVHLHALASVEFAECLAHPLAIGLVRDLGFGRGRVVLVMGVLDMREQTSPPADQVLAPSEQIACDSHLGGIRVRLGNASSRLQGCDLEGVDLVVLRFPAVDGLHVEGVAKDELDVLAAAQFREPVPGEHALDADHEIIAEGFNGGENVVRPTLHVLVEKGLAVPVQNAQVHGLRVQVDPTVVIVALGVESHWLYP